jgi:predicted acylesterase/phospholipase RssA
MNNRISLQLAIQGGGAKIVTLVAAMEALEGLQDKVRVTRIAGTSAGAIVGCLFAAGISMKEVKQELHGDLGRAITRGFSPPRKIKGAMKIAMGHPLWDIGPFERWLRRKFEDKEKRYLRDLLPIDVLVVSADLGNSERREYPSDHNIVDALMDSCGIPYFFKTWNKGGAPVYVDGGICENLPIAELQRRAKSGDGPIVALTFEDMSPGHPRTLKEFTSAIIDTAINNSIKRAKSTLNPNFVHKIRTTIKTFDFRVALTEGLKEPYELVRERADRWFRDFVTQQESGGETVSGDPWLDPNPTASKIMGNLGEVYKAQHLQRKFEYLECNFEVTTHSLFKPEEDRFLFKNPDVVKYSAKFMPANEPIWCLRIHLAVPPKGRYLGRTWWTVRNKNGQLTSSIGIPAWDIEKPAVRFLIIFFNPPLLAEEGPYTLEFVDEEMDVMRDLRSGKDELRFSFHRAASAIGKVNLVLHLPSGRKSARMEPKSEVPAGQAMTEQELAGFDRRVGFRTLGWTASKIEPREFGVDVFSDEKIERKDLEEEEL